MLLSSFEHSPPFFKVLVKVGELEQIPSCSNRIEVWVVRSVLTLESLHWRALQWSCCILWAHSDDTHSQLWVGSDSRAKLATLFIQIVAGIQTSQLNVIAQWWPQFSQLMLHTQARQLNANFAQNVRLALRCKIRISLPDAHAGLTAHKLAHSHARPTTGPHTGPLPAAPLKGRGPAVWVTTAMNPGFLRCC